ncbi:MAG: hypothetical protein WKF75_02085 [Singulisphaera sp.]
MSTSAYCSGMSRLSSNRTAGMTVLPSGPRKERAQFHCTTNRGPRLPQRLEPHGIRQPGRDEAPVAQSTARVGVGATG